jgi:ubiquinone/menaquinone biosynthesis C-methylase UbiE
VTSATALYTDLSAYYDLMCSYIDYAEQSRAVLRLNRLFGNGGNRYLDLACGTGPHVQHFLQAGFQAQGLDIHPPMLDIAQKRCPDARFFQGDMAGFSVDSPCDIISCFLYSIHYNNTIDKLQKCIARVHAALQAGGMFCFNAVDKTTINNQDGVTNTVLHEGSELHFSSSWFYKGEGDEQALRVRIEKNTRGKSEVWQDEHAMVAVSFVQLQALLQPFFDVHIFEHNYASIVPWAGKSGNALLVCVKR